MAPVRMYQDCIKTECRRIHTLFRHHGDMKALLKLYSHKKYIQRRKQNIVKHIICTHIRNSHFLNWCGYSSWINSVLYTHVACNLPVQSQTMRPTRANIGNHHICTQFMHSQCFNFQGCRSWINSVLYTHIIWNVESIVNCWLGRDVVQYHTE